MKQLFLKPRDGEPPSLALRDIPQPGEVPPPDMVMLAGATIEATSRFDKDSAWRACSKIAELCEAGVHSAEHTQRLIERADAAISLMADVLAYARGNTELNRTSATVLAKSALDELHALEKGLRCHAYVVPSRPMGLPGPEAPETTESDENTRGAEPVPTAGASLA